MWKFTRWFTSSWYEYLFSKPWMDKLTFRMLICRIKGHPAGVAFYNPSGLEPDMTCRNCGEDLG
jgi:hypothetical protein